MTKYPELDYIKWDANAPIMNHGSQYLTSDNQSHLYIEYHRGFEKVKFTKSIGHFGLNPYTEFNAFFLSRVNKSLNTGRQLAYF